MSGSFVKRLFFCASSYSEEKLDASSVILSHTIATIVCTIAPVILNFFVAIEFSTEPRKTSKVKFTWALHLSRLGASVPECKYAVKKRFKWGNAHSQRRSYERINRVIVRLRRWRNNRAFKFCIDSAGKPNNAQNAAVAFLPFLPFLFLFLFFAPRFDSRPTGAALSPPPSLCTRWQQLSRGLRAEEQLVQTSFGPLS